MFKATLFEMRQKFIVIALIDEQNKPIGTLKINLYLLATGPYHQDFAIPLPKAPGARLSFNLKVAQLVKIRMRINDVKLVPKNKEFPGDTFAFALRSIVTHQLCRLAISHSKMASHTSTWWDSRRAWRAAAWVRRRQARQTATFRQSS